MASTSDSSKFHFVQSNGTRVALSAHHRSHAIRAGLQLRLAPATSALPQDPPGDDATQLRQSSSRFRVNLGKPRSGAAKPALRRGTRRALATGRALGDDDDVTRVEQIHTSGTGTIQRFGATASDPFASLPIPCNWRVDRLVKQSTLVRVMAASVS